MNNLVIITGPTAVGKTEISIELAKAINGEIISADSIQVYKYMDIGSAKIKKEEMQGIKHYLIDEFEPDDEFNVNVFQKLTKKYINEIYEKGKTPIIVGGTGFYIQSVLYDIDFEKGEENTAYRKKLETYAKEHGAQALHDRLREADPKSADAIHANNGVTLENGVNALGNININGGKISIYSNDDGIHADGVLTISDGIIDITKSYEGLEGLQVIINNGDISIVSSDDGINSTVTFNISGKVIVDGYTTQANTKVDAIEFTLTQNGKSMTVKGFRKTGWEGEDY